MRGVLKSAILPILLLATAWLGLPAASKAADGDRHPKAPDFTAKDLEGKKHSLSELLKEGPVFIDFWTTWCKPCKLELPELDRLHTTYGKNGFRVVAIAQDDQKTVRKVKPYVQSQKYEMLVLVDPKREVGTTYNVRTYPTSFLVNQDGEIVHFAVGFNLGDEKQLETLIRDLLELPESEDVSEESK